MFNACVFLRHIRSCHSRGRSLSTAAHKLAFRIERLRLAGLACTVDYLATGSCPGTIVTVRHPRRYISCGDPRGCLSKACRTRNGNARTRLRLFQKSFVSPRYPRTRFSRVLGTISALIESSQNVGISAPKCGHQRAGSSAVLWRSKRTAAVHVLIPRDGIVQFRRRQRILVPVPIHIRRESRGRSQ